jgi:hypothetical protein
MIQFPFRIPFRAVSAIRLVSGAGQLLSLRFSQRAFSEIQTDVLRKRQAKNPDQLPFKEGRKAKSLGGLRDPSNGPSRYTFFLVSSTSQLTGESGEACLVPRYFETAPAVPPKLT